MPLNRTLQVVFVVLLLHSMIAMTTGFTHTIMDQHGFRQTQTAITVEYLVKGGPWINYETPVLGPPWSIPFEFPLYQWIVASVVVLFGIPIDQAGRIISALFFFATLPPLYVLLRRIGLSAEQRLPFLILMVTSPLYIFWSRTVMIESCVLFLSVAYLALAAQYLQDPKLKTACLIVAAGALAAMVKITTFYGFALCAALLLLADRFFQSSPAAGYRRRQLTFAICAGVLPTFAGIGWSLFAEAKRVSNPLASFLSLNGLHDFNYGPLNQRLSPELWQVIWSRSFTDILGSNLVIIPMIVALPFVRRRERILLAICAAVFFIVELTFTNLHFVHNYYQYANGAFLIGALGFCVAGLVGIQGPARASGLLLLALTVAFGLHHYYGAFATSQDVNNTSFVGTSKAIQEHSKPDDVVMVYGMDWSPELLYASDRRGIMVRDGQEDSAVRKAIANLGTTKIGAVAMCFAARENRETILQRTCSYGLRGTVAYEDNVCSVLLPSTEAAACSDSPPTNGQPPITQTLGNVDAPVPGTKVRDSVNVIGWTLPQSGLSEIAIYLDTLRADTAQLGMPRPDVQQAYPQFENSVNSGFYAAIKLGSVDAGTHTLRVELRRTDGSRYDLAKIPLTVAR